MIQYVRYIKIELRTESLGKLSSVAVIWNVWTNGCFDNLSTIDGRKEINLIENLSKQFMIYYFSLIEVYQLK